MALLFIDSFDHYATADLLEKWTSSGNTPSIAAVGRHSSNGLRCTLNCFVAKARTTASPTAIVGVAMKTTGAGTNDRCLGIHDAGTGRDQAYVAVNTDGSVSAYRGFAGSGGIAFGAGTLLGTSATGLVSLNVSAYIEMKVLLHATAGTFTIRVNGVSALALTGQNTANGSTAWTTAWIGAFTNNTYDFDDLYVSDGLGATPWNDVLGDCRVDALYPTGAGATTGWTPSTGANWSCVDETAPNDDTDYTSASASPLTDTFVVQDAPVAGAVVYGVQHCLNVKKVDAGAATLAPVIRHGGADFVGTDLAPGTAYAYATQLAQTNPGTSAQWTAAGVNAAEFGYRKTT